MRVVALALCAASGASGLELRGAPAAAPAGPGGPGGPGRYNEAEYAADWHTEWAHGDFPNYKETYSNSKAVSQYTDRQSDGKASKAYGLVQTGAAPAGAPAGPGGPGGPGRYNEAEYAEDWHTEWAHGDFPNYKETYSNSKAVSQYTDRQSDGKASKAYGLIQTGAAPAGAPAEVMPFLIDIMNTLESKKAEIPEYTPEEGRQFVTSFALGVFKKADDEDRAGQANKSTAKSFYAAVSFFEVIKEFGEVPDEIQEMAKYAKWKATDILAALKQGRRPVPGPPGGLGDEETPAAIDSPNPGGPPLNHSDTGLGLSDLPPAAPLGQGMGTGAGGSADDAALAAAGLLDLPPAAPVGQGMGGALRPGLTPFAPPADLGAAGMGAGAAPRPGLTPFAPPADLLGGPSGPAAAAYPPADAAMPVALPPAASAAPRARERKKLHGQYEPHVLDAIELCYFAIAALEEKDVALGETRLSQALAAARGRS